MLMLLLVLMLFLAGLFDAPADAYFFHRRVSGITLDNSDSVNSAISSASITLSAFTTAGTNRYLVCCLAIRGGVTSPSITYGGVAVNDFTGTLNASDANLHVAAEAGMAAGSSDVVASWTTDRIAKALTCTSWNGVDQVTPEGVTASSDPGTLGTSVSVTLNSTTAGNTIVDCLAGRDQPADTTSGQTEIVEDGVGGGTQITSAQSQAAAGGNITMDYSWDSSTNRAIYGIEIDAN